MKDIFLKLLDMSLSASWIILAVIAARLVLKKAPKWINCALWALVAVRLLCPFTLESALSLIPNVDFSREVVTFTGDSESREILADYSHSAETVPEGETGRTESYGIISDSKGNVLAVKELKKSELELDWYHIFSLFWLVGLILMAAYAAISYLRIRRKVAVSIELGNDVFLCDYIDSPFILGIVKPKIYLPSEMDPADAAHVLAHERAHLKRKDHWWKPLGFALLAVYWFNPLLWVAYILLCRDIELACDERVIKKLDAPEKKAYSEALLKCSMPRHMIMACPLAFGEVGVKQRVKSVLHYKKPGFWILLVSILVILVVAVCFLTDPVELESPFNRDLWVSELVYSRDGSPITESDSDFLGLMDLGTNVSIIGSSTLDGFEEVTLTEENFNDLFEEDGFWYSGSLKKLRRQNVNAWVLHDYHLGIYRNYHYFYYLLQQKNGDLYLVYARQWDAKIRPGRSWIKSVYKLEDALTNRVFEDGDSPFIYTRTLKNAHLETSQELFAWWPVNAHQADGDSTTYEIWRNDLLNLVNTIPEDAFSLGTPIQDVEVSFKIDIADNNIFDVTLRYGDGKVDMVFHENATWSYADTGEQAWIIDYEPLEKYLARYSRKYTLPDYLENPQDAYEWCQNVEVDDIQWFHVIVINDQVENGGYDPGYGRVEHFLSELKKVPASAFVSIDTEVDCFQEINAGAIEIGLYSPKDVAYEEQSHIFIQYVDEKLYFSVRDYDGNALRSWQIMDDDFIAYQAELYDITELYGFHTMNNATGTIHYTHNYASISMDTYAYLDYEIVEYTDDVTPFGICYRPKAVDEAWVFLAFFPNGFTPEPEWLVNGYVGMDEYNSPLYYEKTEDGVFLRARHYTGLAGDYVVLYEGTEQWLKEYEDEVTYSWSFEDQTLAADYLKKGEIIDIVMEQVGSIVYVEVDGESRKASLTFDHNAGIWTLATDADEEHASVVAVQLDVYGKIVS